jgi:hypothetical protein
MQTTIQMSLLAATSESGFSLDEFILTLHTLMEQKGMAGIASLILSILQERLCLDLCRNTANTWRPEESCCDSPAYELAQCRLRQIRTRIGTLHVPWRALRCRHCRKTFLPLRQFLGLEAYQRKTNELEYLVVEVVSEQSYRRATSHLEKIGSIPVPKSTAHRWVADSDCDAVDTGTDGLDFLYADGTGFKRRPNPKTGRDNRGEIRLAFGLETTGKIRPLGAWSGTSWRDIARTIQGRRGEDRPVAETLLSDGEPGLLEAMGRLCDVTQRCHWHAGRDLNYAMWKDDAPRAERNAATKELAGILAISLPKDDVELVSPDDKMALEDAVMTAEQSVETLCRRLFRRGYLDAWNYVKRMKRSLFEYVRRWLETGLVTPRAASLIERVMREVARRLKRIAHGWSDSGAAKMACVILKRFTNPNAWDAYWKKKLRLDGNVLWIVRKIELAPTPLGR